MSSELADSLQDSIALITSHAPDNSRFGTGFVFRQRQDAAYVLTCAHVVRDVGGDQQVMVDGMAATVVSSGEADGIDLAVLRVEGVWGKPPLPLRFDGSKGLAFVTAGFQRFTKEERLIQPLRGTLGDQVGLQSKQPHQRISAWYLQIADDYALKDGYSGSPVVDKATGEVIGIISHRQGDQAGLAVSSEVLKAIWKIIDREQLYEILLKLGYRRQVRLFRQLVSQHAVAGFLIHGAPEHGQAWLLNRLVREYVDYNITGKKIRIDLARKVRRSDVSALWRELGRQVGLRRGQPERSEVVKRVYRAWQTQNVLLIIHDVNVLREDWLQDLIENFWAPLTAEIRDTRADDHKYRLLMFLIDYEGCTGDWKVPLVEKLDLSWKPELPVRSPKLSAFTPDELERWVDDQYKALPLDITHAVDEAVEAILENTDNGIPERVLEELCDYCGWDWYEVSDQWLTL